MGKLQQRWLAFGGERVEGGEVVPMRPVFVD
jgi:hypothetical protein